MMSGLELKPVFRAAWTGVETECGKCGKSIPASEWFYRFRDDDGVLKWLCCRCKKKEEAEG